MVQMVTDVNAHLVTRDWNVQMWTTVQTTRVRTVELATMEQVDSSADVLDSGEELIAPKVIKSSFNLPEHF